MKQVIKECNTVPTITAKDTNINKYYGVIHNSGPKGFITSKSHHGYLMVLALSGLTYGNNFTSFNGYTKIDDLCIEILSKDFVVYEFDTPQELFKWLAEP